MTIEPGLRLKSVREKLGLRYREVEQASNQIARRRHNSDFVLGLSRLADIENKGVVPSLHRLYSLCAIYRLDYEEVLSWYGIETAQIWQDATLVQPENTHPLDIGGSRRASVSLPLHLDPGVDLDQTTYLSRVIQDWGRIPLSLLETLDIDRYRYGMVGFQDTMMHPMIPPGSLVQIDDSRRDIAQGTWANEFERPIYFLEFRDRYACCWCSVSEKHLILQPHSGSPDAPEIVDSARDVDVIGQVVGVAMQLTPQPEKRRRLKKKARSATAPG